MRFLVQGSHTLKIPDRRRVVRVQTRHRNGFASRLRQLGIVVLPLFECQEFEGGRQSAPRLLYDSLQHCLGVLHARLESRLVFLAGANLLQQGAPVLFLLDRLLDVDDRFQRRL